jgi:hypothetical protein
MAELILLPGKQAIFTDIVTSGPVEGTNADPPRWVHFTCKFEGASFKERFKEPPVVALTPMLKTKNHFAAYTPRTVTVTKDGVEGDFMLGREGDGENHVAIHVIAVGKAA